MSGTGRTAVAMREACGIGRALSSRWEERARESRLARPIPAAPAFPSPTSQAAPGDPWSVLG